MNKVTKLGFVAMLLPLVSFAEEATHAAAPSAANWISLAVGLGIALAVMAASTAQGRIAASFMEGAARNPGAVGQMRTPLILSLIFVETLVLFTVLIVLMLVGKM